MLISLLKHLRRVKMADSFVHELENFEAVITSQPDHFSDSLLDQGFRQTFLSILVGSFHRLLYSAFDWDMYKCPGNLWNLLTVKHDLRFNIYCTTKHYVSSIVIMNRHSKAICLHALKWTISYNQTISLILTFY